jgi:hypothetical protein
VGVSRAQAISAPTTNKTKKKERMRIEFEDRESLELFELLEIMRELAEGGERKGPFRVALVDALLEVTRGFLRDITPDDEDAQTALDRELKLTFECLLKNICISRN